MATPTEKCPPFLWAGPPCEIEPGRIAATQTFGIGTPVYKKDGQFTLCVDSDATADKAIYGFVWTAQDAPTENTEIYVAKISPDQLWGVWVSTSGTDTAAAVGTIGDEYGHRVEAATPYAGYMTLDINLSTHLSMRIEAIASDLNTDLVASVSTSPGLAIVRFLQAALDQVGP